LVLVAINRAAAVEAVRDGQQSPRPRCLIMPLSGLRPTMPRPVRVVTDG
jgi:hypothetical protein